MSGQRHFYNLPYRYDFRPAGEDLFKDREDEMEAASQALLSHQSVALIGERRIGKTSFWQALQRRMEKEEGVLFASVRTWRTLEDLEAFRKEALRAALRSRIGELPTLEFPELLELAAVRGVRVVVCVFEEVDASLLGLPEAQRKEAIEKVLQVVPPGPWEVEILGLFEGCLPLLELFEQESSSLRSESVELGPLPREDADRVLTERYRRELFFPPATLDRAHHFCGGHPFLINVLGNALVDRINRRLKETVDVSQVPVLDNDVEAAIGDVLEGDVFKDYWRHLTTFHLCREEQEALSELARSGALVGRDVTAARLVRKGYLRQDGVGFCFRIGAFGEWLNRGTEAPGVIEPWVGEVRLEGDTLFVGETSVLVDEIELTLLRELIEAQGEIVTYADLAGVLWPGESLDWRKSRSRTLPVIRTLCGKIGDDPEDPRRLLDVRGKGFRWSGGGG